MTLFPPAAEKAVLSVSAALEKARDAVEGLKSFWLEGEVGDLRNWRGFLFFTLKDDKNQLRCVLSPEWARVSPYQPEKSGEKILVWGRLSVFEKRGELQFEVLKAEPVGAGAQALALRKLQEQLAREGLFSRKRPLPVYPEKVGLVTSAGGAALRDIEKIFGADPLLSRVLAPVRVQGEGAPADIAAALRKLSSRGDLDLIVLARGGGSQEDLAAFQTEEVARALYEASCPTISAVGHEVDVTLADLVADLRAATPSQGAELVLARRRQALERFEEARRSLARAARASLVRARERLARARLEPLMKGWALSLKRRRSELEDFGGRLLRPLRRLRKDGALRLAEASARLPGLGRKVLKEAGARPAELALALRRGLRLRLERAASRLAEKAAGLEARSPLAVLARGYSLVYDESSSTPLREARQTAPGRALRLRLHRGGLRARVEEVLPENT